VLHRRRSEDAAPPPELHADDTSFRLAFPPGWLAAHPLTRADLETEAGYLKSAGLKLKIR